MVKQLLLPFLAVAAFIVVVGLLVQGKLGNISSISTPQSTQAPNIIKIDDTEIQVEIAKTNEERQKGLGGKESLAENSGMLFVIPENNKPTFWMKDTLIPLDIIWIKDNKVAGIEKNVQAQIGVEDSKLKLYPAPGIVDFVLEVNAGFSEKNNLKINSSVEIFFEI